MCVAYGSNANAQLKPREVVLRVAGKHASRRGTATFLREVAPAATAMAPGLCGVGGGMPRPTPCIRLVSVLLPRDVVRPLVAVGAHEPFVAPWLVDGEPLPTTTAASNANHAAVPPSARVTVSEPMCSVPLHQICVARSGDKVYTITVIAIVICKHVSLALTLNTCVRV